MEKVSDYDVLRRHHRFVREEGEDDSSWEARVAKNYESKLFKEFALIDLKHYKSSRYALRWRTATEVVDGIGDETCAGLRCERHRTPTRTTAFELPFVYVEEGERRETMVKVRICRRCEAKLTWRPEKEKDGGGRERRRSKSKGGEGEDGRRSRRSEEADDRERRHRRERRGEEGKHDRDQRERSRDRRERSPVHRDRTTKSSRDRRPDNRDRRPSPL